jgi:hypothetical protein
MSNRGPDRSQNANAKRAHPPTEDQAGKSELRRGDANVQAECTKMVSLPARLRRENSEHLTWGQGYC